MSGLSFFFFFILNCKRKVSLLLATRAKPRKDTNWLKLLDNEITGIPVAHPGIAVLRSLQIPILVSEWKWISRRGEILLTKTADALQKSIFAAAWVHSNRAIGRHAKRRFFCAEKMDFHVSDENFAPKNGQKHFWRLLRSINSVKYISDVFYGVETPWKMFRTTFLAKNMDQNIFDDFSAPEKRPKIFLTSFTKY